MFFLFSRENMNLLVVAELAAGLTALGVAADIILNYLLKAAATTAINSIQAEQATAVNSIVATTQTAVNAILSASELHDVYSIAHEKIKDQAQAQAK